jgi:hypothetical protein
MLLFGKGCNIAKRIISNNRIFVSLINDAWHYPPFAEPDIIRLARYLAKLSPTSHIRRLNACKRLDRSQ